MANARSRRGSGRERAERRRDEATRDGPPRRVGGGEDASRRTREGLRSNPLPVGGSGAERRGGRARRALPIRLRHPRAASLSNAREAAARASVSAHARAPTTGMSNRTPPHDSRAPRGPRGAPLTSARSSASPHATIGSAPPSPAPRARPSRSGVLRLKWKKSECSTSDKVREDERR